MEVYNLFYRKYFLSAFTTALSISWPLNLDIWMQNELKINFKHYSFMHFSKNAFLGQLVKILLSFLIISGVLFSVTPAIYVSKKRQVDKLCSSRVCGDCDATNRGDSHLQLISGEIIADTAATSCCVLLQTLASALWSDANSACHRNQMAKRIACTDNLVLFTSSIT